MARRGSSPPWFYPRVAIPPALRGSGGSIEPQHASLLLHVLDSSGAPIPSAAVTVQGSTQPTDGAGYIFFDNLAPGRFVAKVESWGYAPASAVVELPVGVHGGTEVHLLPLGAPIPFDAASGAVLDQGPIRVSIPPAGLVDHNGEPVTGTVEATIVPFDPTQGLDKFDANGNHLWSKRFGDSSDDEANSVAIDSAGNIVITGHIRGTVDFGGGPLTSADQSADIFVVKFDPIEHPQPNRCFPRHL